MEHFGENGQIPNSSAVIALKLFVAGFVIVVRLGVLTPAFVNSVGSSTWDSAADGGRFLKVTMSGPQQYTVVLNWRTGLKK
jgi:hypothetical protein